VRISHSNRFVFLSNPRCASTLMRLILAPFADIQSTDSDPLHHHNNAQGLKIYFGEQGWDWNGYFKFTFVRNPWERMVSFYHFGKWDRHYWPFWSPKYEESSAGRVSFKEWLIRKVRNRYLVLFEINIIPSSFKIDFCYAGHKTSYRMAANGYRHCFVPMQW